MRWKSKWYGWRHVIVHTQFPGISTSTLSTETPNLYHAQQLSEGSLGGWLVEDYIGWILTKMLPHNLFLLLNKDQN